MTATRNSMRQKYSISRYYYTKLFEVSLYGGSLIRPLFFEFPHDSGVYAKTESMFMIGPALLVAPVLHKGAVLSYPYCTNEDWYDLRTFAKVYSYKPGEKNGAEVKVPGGFDFVPVLIRGGSIIPYQPIERVNRITSMPKMLMTLLLAPDHNGEAKGTIVVDDGVSIDTIKNKTYTHLEFKFSMDRKIMVVKILNNRNPQMNTEEMVTSITVLGAEKLASKPSLCVTITENERFPMYGSFNRVTGALVYRKARGEIYWEDVLRVDFLSDCN
eukprot:TRINITY_DN7530_c0_g2_i3.p1 TRINITY_DN7530_c0_g2~~TRINITY_DN7530_c0_g2_i3.p1  ORF type:complete len:271 (-),score=47.99 TRINITY_DN7530_c0_g2_i3:149-961(-)